MIRINLLPVRAFKKKENIRKQVSIYVLTVLFLIGVMGFFYMRKANVVRELESEQAVLADQEKKLKETVKEVDDLKKEEEELQEKLKIIAELETKRTGPVRILDEISRRIPSGKAFLVALTKENDKMGVNGVAIDNESIALFLSKLEQSEYFDNVQLVKSSQEIRNEMRLKSFAINCNIVLAREEAEASEEGQDKDQAKKAKTASK